MDKSQSIHILKQLANGIDPNTGEMLPEHNPCQHPQTVRALFYAIMVLEKTKETATRHLSVDPRLANAGKAWDKVEDDQLIEEFDSGMSVRVLAEVHKRTITAIESRLVKLGKVADGRYIYSHKSN